MKGLYEEGERVMVGEVVFYDPDKGDSPVPNMTCIPGVNDVAGVLGKIGTRRTSSARSPRTPP